MVPQRHVVRPEEPRVGWHAEDETTARTQNSADLVRCPGVVADVLQYVGSENQIEGAIPKRDGGSHRSAEMRSAAGARQRERSRIWLDTEDLPVSARHSHVAAGPTAEIQEALVRAGAPTLKQISEHAAPSPEPPVVELLVVHHPVLISAHDRLRT